MCGVPHYPSYYILCNKGKKNNESSKQDFVQEKVKGIPTVLKFVQENSKQDFQRGKAVQFSAFPPRLPFPSVWIFFFFFFSHTKRVSQERERERELSLRNFFFSLPLTISIVGSVLLVFIHKPIKKLVRVSKFFLDETPRPRFSSIFYFLGNWFQVPIWNSFALSLVFIWYCSGI